jgi:Mannosyltransferase (PIG-V)
MNPDTAEMAIVDPAVVRAQLGAHTGGAPVAAAESTAAQAGEALPGAPAMPAGGTLGRGALGQWWRGPSENGLAARVRVSDPARAQALRDTWKALWVSRALVWVAGVGVVATVGFGPIRNAFNPPGVTSGFGWLGDLLAAPAARWDAAWYLVIAHYGYRPELGSFTSSRDAFFPLYPLGVSALTHVGVQPVLAGVLVSLLAFAAALYGIHRLTTLELGSSLCRGSGDVARLTVLVTALAPMAFFFSAVYSESLYLALSVGVFLCARRGRWMWVGVLGALAAATRSAGIVLLAPALLLYLYGPREDGAPAFAPGGDEPWHAGEPRRNGRRLAGGRRAVPLDWRTMRARARACVRPRYRLRRDFLWLALMPAGLGAYMAYLWLAGGDALAPFHAQDVWQRHFAGPYLGVWDGIKAAFDGARQLLSGQRGHVYFPIAGGSPFITAGHNLMLLAFLVVGLALLVAVLRMLPLAYGVYIIAALALPLSYPVAPQPLMSLPRFLVVLFPLSMVIGAWLAARPRARAPVLIVSAAMMMFFVAEFATWHWVA